MIELLQFAIHPYNFVLTLLLGLVVLYWLSVIVGVLDLDVLDFDLDGPDADLDLDMDAEMDVDGDADLDSGGGFFSNLLSFMFVGEVPLTVVASTFILVMWVAVVMANHSLQTDSWKMAALVMLGGMLASFVATRVLLTPLRAVFKRMSAEDQQLKDVLGLKCTVISAADDTRLGQAETESKGAFVRINIHTRVGIQVDKGDLVKIVAKNGPHSYIVEPIG